MSMARPLAEGLCLQGAGHCHSMRVCAPGWAKGLLPVQVTTALKNFASVLENKIPGFLTIIYIFKYAFKWFHLYLLQ